MKTHIRIPTTTYGYLEFEFEGSPEDAIAEHNRILKMYNGGFGLETKEWNKVLDRYLLEGKMEADLFSQMDTQQQWLIHELDKSQARLKAKNK